MKNLTVLSEGLKGKIDASKKRRGKLIVREANEEEGSFIEVDNFSGSGDTFKQRKEPIIHIEFADGLSWSGTMELLRKALLT